MPVRLMLRPHLGMRRAHSGHDFAWVSWLGNLPGYVPVADLGVATALLACVIKFYFLFIYTGQQEIATLLANVNLATRLVTSQPLILTRF